MAENTEAASTPNAASPANSTNQDFHLVKDVPVTLQVLLGDTVLTVEDILKFGKGAVVPLRQKVGQPFTILLQHKPIAEGEVVEAGENLGIKITNVFGNE